MTTAKTFYTYAELSKMNTQRLINTYNRIFNTNAWELFFNPYENRTDMLLELMDEMRIIKAMSLLPPVVGPIEKYKALKIVVSRQGMAIVWNNGPKVGNRKASQGQIDLICELRNDGESYRWIASVVGLTDSAVFYIVKKQEKLNAMNQMPL